MIDIDEILATAIRNVWLKSDVPGSRSSYYVEIEGPGGFPQPSGKRVLSFITDQSRGRACDRTVRRQLIARRVKSCCRVLVV